MPLFFFLPDAVFFFEDDVEDFALDFLVEAEAPELFLLFEADEAFLAVFFPRASGTPALRACRIVMPDDDI